MKWLFELADRGIFPDKLICLGIRILNKKRLKEEHPEFFQWILGKRLKYSCCYWPEYVIDLEGAEDAMCISLRKGLNWTMA
jgi:hypothetical protein